MGDARRRIVFSDMDGTFLATDKSVPPENLRALDVLLDRGGVFVPCTGRPAHMLPAELLDHPATRFVVSTNGALISEVDHDEKNHGSVGRAIRTVSLGAERALGLLEAYRTMDVLTDVFTTEGAFMARDELARLGEYIPEPNTLRLLLNVRQATDEPLEDIVRRVDDVSRVTAFWHTQEDCDEVCRVAEGFAGVACASSMPGDMEMTDEGATKGGALVWLCDHTGFDVADAVAFGDSSNDVSMLRVAGDGVAMANGTAPALAVADYVTDADNDNGGLAAYLTALLGE